MINNDDNLTSYKGVSITLDNACIVTDSGMSFNYAVTGKYLEIISNNSTTNYIINNGTGEDDHAVYSDNNVDLNLKSGSVLNITTTTGHGVKADSDVRVYGKGTAVFNAGHDALHGKKFLSNNDDEDDLKVLEGTINVKYAFSQAFDFSTKKTKGNIYLTSGKYIIDSVDTVFKVDNTLSIASGVVVTATNVANDPVLRGDFSTGVTISNNGTFTVDGVNYTATAI